LSVIDDGLARATEVARGLVGNAVEVRPFVGGGRNSRIWHVRSGAREFALKQYPSRQDDTRDRLSTEVGALRLMERYRIDSVPRVVNVDNERGYALLSWIDGHGVGSVSDADIDAALAFLATIHALRQTQWALAQPLAAEACLSGHEIERQLNERLMRLRMAATQEPELFEFLNHSVEPRVAQWSLRARQPVSASALDFAVDLAKVWRSLVPSDFGFHNCLRRADGSLAFMDFEYFGWDDPVKLTADILLHPGSTLPVPQRKRFRQGALSVYGADLAFGQRLRAYLPLFGLRWVLILLNEFIPERWRMRVLAGDGGGWSDAKARQLSRAGQFLAVLPEKLED
jgi:hypothetical protein